MSSYKKGRRGTVVGATIPIYGNFTPRSTVEWIPTDKIHVDTNYQRTLDRERAMKMAREWDQGLAGVPQYSLRDDGFYYAIDGQHRIESLNMMVNTPPSILAEVFRGMTPKDEAEHFVAVQRKRQGLTQGATFHARVFAGEKEALEVVEAAKAAGLTADYRSGPTPNNLRAFGTLTQIHKRQGKQGLERILKVCATAWPNSRYQGARPVLNALEAFYIKYGTSVSDKRLASALSLTEPQILVSQAQTVSNSLSSQISPAMVSIIRNMYNKRLRVGKLPE